jgi:glucose/mannose-6-phosphate isomerase
VTTEALSILDDEAARRRIDSSGLLERIMALPEQCEAARRQAREFQCSDGATTARSVVVLGMGGSAIAGDVLRSLSSRDGSKPLAVVRGYEVPSFVGPETLVVACSHSGNTEETVAAFEAALQKKAQTAVITTGGRLAEIAAASALPAFVYSYEGQPRCALGFQLMALLALGERAGLLGPQDAAVDETLELMRAQCDRLAFEVPSLRNDAKQLARRLHERAPVIVGAGVLADAAHRWKTQMNENAKSWAFWDELPEIDHNSVVGFGLPAELTRQLHVVFLLSEKLDRREEVRYEATAEELLRAGVSQERIDVPGATPLAQTLSAIYLGDFVSYYLALLNNMDPTPIDPITRVKARLAEG